MGDELLKKMQLPGARQAMDKAFNASPEELGAAAVKQAMEFTLIEELEDLIVEWAHQEQSHLDAGKDPGGPYHLGKAAQLGNCRASLERIINEYKGK